MHLLGSVQTLGISLGEGRVCLCDPVESGFGVAVSAPVAGLPPEGSEQLGERLLHLIGRHWHPRLH